MVQFKKELLKAGSCIKCYSEAEAKEVVAWYHANGVCWRTFKSDKTFWRHSLNNCIYYEVINGLLYWRTNCSGLPHVSYYDALLSIDNDTWYAKSFYERIEKMVDEKLKDYQKIEPEPEPEFGVGDIVAWCDSKTSYFGVVTSIHNDSRIDYHGLDDSIKIKINPQGDKCWVFKKNCIKIGHEE